MIRLYILIPIAGVILLNMVIGRIRLFGRRHADPRTIKARKSVTSAFIAFAVVGSIVMIALCLIMALTFS